MDPALTPQLDAEQRLGLLLRKLRAQTPPPPADENSAADLDRTRFDRRDGELTPRAVITLRSSGCGWARHGGGCTMCGHFAGAILKEDPAPSELVAQFEQAFIQVKWSDFPILCLYNGGSILNPREMPRKSLFRILEFVRAEPGIRELAIETRAEFVNEAILREIREGLDGRRLTLAMGLESASDEVRRLCVHKGFPLSRFGEACRLAARYARLRLYVLVKPPWLNEAEAIDDAVAAIRLAASLGAADIHIEPLTIQNHTLLKRLWKRDLYRLPWLWSMIEVLKRAAPIPVYVSPFAHVPRPIAIPHNCGRCDEVLRRRLIEDYNRSLDVGVFDGASCPCQDQWREELTSVDRRPFHERLLADLPLLEASFEG